MVYSISNINYLEYIVFWSKVDYGFLREINPQKTCKETRVAYVGSPQSFTKPRFSSEEIIERERLLNNKVAE